MVSMNRVDYFVLTGATYDNLEAIRKSGAKWDNGSRFWMLKIETHPLNNRKQRKVLEEMLNALEANGVRFIPFYIDAVRK